MMLATASAGPGTASRQRHDEVLAGIARLAGSPLELPDVLDRIVERAATLTGADRTSIWLLDRSRECLIPSALYGMDAAFTEGWKQRPLNVSDERLSKEVIETGLPVVVNDPLGDPRTDKVSVEFFGDRSLLVVPLARHGRVLGTLFMNHVRERYLFTEEDVETAVAIATQAAIAIDTAQIYTEIREEEGRTRHLELTPAEVTSLISHELRTPLALVKAYVRTLLNPPAELSPEQAHYFLAGIDGAADRLQRLIDDLLSASRLESGPFLIQPQRVQAGGLVRRAVEDTWPLAGDREIVVEDAAAAIWLLGDPDQLGRVLENLIGNAIKYAPEGDALRLRVRREGNVVQITVQDSGPGVPPDALERIFEKFYRLPAEHSARSSSGLGLGLYICRRIVEAHGGRIWAENVVGGGCAFHVELPALAGDLTALPAPDSCT